MLSVVFLGGPYWHEDPEVRSWRAVQYSKAVAAIVTGPSGESTMVYSPVAYGHAIDGYFDDRGVSESYWRRHGIAMLRRSDQLWILKLEGWEESRGLEAELDVARRSNMEITYIEPQSLGLSAVYEPDVFPVD